jgi:hypothetical protein
MRNEFARGLHLLSLTFIAFEVYRYYGDHLFTGREPIPVVAVARPLTRQEKIAVTPVAQTVEQIQDVQKKHMAETGTYAQTPEELGIKPPPGTMIMMTTGRDGYTVRARKIDPGTGSDVECSVRSQETPAPSEALLNTALGDDNVRCQHPAQPDSTNSHI